MKKYCGGTIYQSTIYLTFACHHHINMVHVQKQASAILPFYHIQKHTQSYYEFCGSSPVRGLLCVLTPRSKMCCLAKCSLLCSAPFWLSRVATRASSSSIVSSSSPSLPADEGPCFNRSSLVDNLNSQDNRLSYFKAILHLMWCIWGIKTMIKVSIKQNWQR